MTRPPAVRPDTPHAFARDAWLMAALLVVLVITFGLYSWSEKQIDRAYDLRHRSLLLADELRQSSDDLTRMARSYVVTGNPRYRSDYQRILDIRDGRQPRPAGYQNVYWDLVTEGVTPPVGTGPAIALLALLRQVGLSAQEFDQLAQAKANSDDLSTTETAAMQLVEVAGATAATNRALALQMTHDARYHQAKAAIMQPIAEFNQLLDRRTSAAIQAAKTQAVRMKLLVVTVGLSLMVLAWRMSEALHATLGGSVDEVYAHIARIGRADFSSTILVTSAQENSVLGWLAKTQANLEKIDHERRQAQAGLQHSSAALDRQGQVLARSSADLQRFAEVTAHHLQEPVRRIASFAERLSAQLAGRLADPEAQLSLHFIDQQARRMKVLLGDVERYLAADQPRGTIAMTDANALVARVLDGLAGRIAAAGAVVALGDLPRAWIDAPRLTDLFEVTLDNALLYGVAAGGRRADGAWGAAPAGARRHIGIAGERQGALVRYRVTDNGPGIAAQYRERVFRVFERLAPAGEETGIGLAIVRRIAENCGGRAWIEETPGGGCCVLFEIFAEKIA